MNGLFFKNLSRVGVLAVGFITGLAFIGSCSSGGGSAADAQTPVPITAGTITRVMTSGNTAVCPAGTVLTGGGCNDLNTGCVGGAYVAGSFPMPSVEQWKCYTGCVTSGTAAPQAFALCAGTTPAGAITTN